ncbi:ABC transporter substrate-binding protein [Nesterenkonia flava]|uniref:ABC transporter substrate-binding protein n=1 Tax=Nesterenkonia flava TaxID=469799 RepID=A0ABU1FR16_9MICC|nr:ABC transporter substrate-binding protein [Nesterenkonia flava]MDR5710707.1 ABC transporter substrate-binding protein [Nesterenkonia flava]
MAHRTRSTTLLTTALLSGLLLAACGDNGDSADAGSEEGSGLSGTITLYTSEPQEKIDELIADFNEVEPDIEVEVFRAGTGDLTARLESELANGAPGADVFLAADAPTVEGFKEQDLLLQMDSEEADAVDEEFKDSEGYYYGTRIIPTVIAYNTNDVDTPPASWQELTDSQHQGQITLPNPAVSGAAAFNTSVWYLHEDLGETWFEDLGANSPVMQDSNGPVGQAVADGSQPIGIVVDFMMRDLRDAGSPVEVSYPEEGVPYIFQPIGIFEATDEPKAAQAFVDYVISQRGQEFAVGQNYLPVREDAGSPEGALDLFNSTIGTN